MGSIGACRQCAVRLYWTDREGNERSEIAMACMTEAQEGTRIVVDDDEAIRFRAQMIELMMMSHPHDCPVCDEGGECHLQDMTVMTGHSYRRYRGRKRTFRNQDLGPFVAHEMNRCITCYRCTRFYNDYAGGRDFGVFGLRNQVYFGRAADGPLESEFSGNLVEVCPTGVFTDKTLGQHYSRKWDLQTAPSVCPHCGLGCTTTPGARYGELRRVLSRYNDEINKTFLCDRGRFGYPFVNAEGRVRAARIAGRPAAPATMTGATAAAVSAAASERALDAAASLICDRRVIGIGSPRASLEANFALRALVGAERFYLGMSAVDHDLVGTVLEIARDGRLRLGVARATSHDADAVVVLGEDLTDTAPMLDLTLRTWLRLRPTAEEERVHIRPLERRRRRTRPSGAQRARCGWRRPTRPSSTRWPPRAGTRRPTTSPGSRWRSPTSSTRRPRPCPIWTPPSASASRAGPTPSAAAARRSSSRATSAARPRCCAPRPGSRRPCAATRRGRGAGESGAAAGRSSSPSPRRTAWGCA